jgi:hypothetical protein
MGLKRTVKPINGEELSDYWKRCEGRFLDGWYSKAIKYAEVNGGKHYTEGWTSKIRVKELNQ